MKIAIDIDDKTKDARVVIDGRAFDFTEVTIQIDMDRRMDGVRIIKAGPEMTITFSGKEENEPLCSGVMSSATV